MRIILWVMAGALGGFLYYYFVGCYSGSCPIQSNPIFATGYGAAFGLALSSIGNKQPK